MVILPVEMSLPKAILFDRNLEGLFRDRLAKLYVISITFYMHDNIGNNAKCMSSLSLDREDGENRYNRYTLYNTDRLPDRPTDRYRILITGHHHES